MIDPFTRASPQYRAAMDRRHKSGPAFEVLSPEASAIASGLLRIAVSLVIGAAILIGPWIAYAVLVRRS